MNLFNAQTEKEIIGGLLNHPDALIDVMGYLSADDFYSPDMVTAFHAIGEAYSLNSKTTATEMAEKSQLKPELLAQCLEAGWFTADIKHKAKSIVELAHKRRTLQSCKKLAYELPGMTSEQISSQLSEIAASISIKSTMKKVYNNQELCIRVSKMQEERFEYPGIIRGIRMGLHRLDNQVRGLRPKRITVIAAATGFGKSTLALNLFANIVKSGHKALFLSNENDVDDNLDRLCGISSGLDMKDIEHGRNYEQVTNSFVQDYFKKDLFISDNSARNIDEVVATISKHAIQNQIEIAFVDYIGEISGDSKDRENEEQKLARYAQRILDCSKNLNIHIVVLAQLNREGNKKGRPSKAELAGCFRIAQKAHTLLLFWQEENKQDVLTVEKNRQGPAGVDVALEFNRNKQTIHELGIWLSSTKEILA
jgi:replicative DNA helicase